MGVKVMVATAFEALGGGLASSGSPRSAGHGAGTGQGTGPDHRRAASHRAGLTTAVSRPTALG